MENKRTSPALPWRPLSIVLIGTFLGPMGGIIVGVALPTIQAKFGASLSEAKWVLMIYLLVTTFLLPVTGWLGRRFGEGRLFTLGFAIDGIATLLSGMVPESMLWLLILLRAVQAIGSALVFALFSALITRLVPQEMRGRAFGLAGAAVGVSLLLSPPLGGILCEYVSWRWVFFVQVPLQLLGFVLSLRLLPREQLGSPERLPYTSVAAWLFVTSGLVLIAEAFENPQWLAWLPYTIAVSLLAIAVFAWSELRLRPLFDYSLFREKAFVLGGLGLMLINLIFFVMVVLTPYYLEFARGYTASQYGRLLAISPLFTLFISPYAGRIADRRGFRLPIVLGLAFGFAGFALLAFAVGRDNMGIMALALALLGLAGGLFNAPALTAMMGSAGPERRSKASSMASLLRNIGFMAGTSIGSILFAHYLASQPGLAQGFRLSVVNEELLQSLPPAAIGLAVSSAFWVCAAIALLTLLLCLGFPERLRPPSTS